MLGSEPVHAILFLCEASNPRMTSAVVDLFDAILYKLDRCDYDKVHFVQNKHSMDEISQAKRTAEVAAILGRPATEADVQRQVITKYLDFFRSESSHPLQPGTPATSVHPSSPCDLFHRPPATLHPGCMPAQGFSVKETEGWGAVRRDWDPPACCHPADSAWGIEMQPNQACGI